MVRAVARPYLTASPNAASTDERPWRLEVDGVEITADELRRLAGTDRDLYVSTAMDIDYVELCQSTGLNGEAINVIFVWECIDTKRRQVGARSPVDPNGFVLGNFVINCAELAGTLTIERQLVLAARLEPASSFHAREPGSILWRDPNSLRIDLGGTGGVLPTDIVTFDGALNTSAVWALRLDLEDLTLPATACIQLLLNRDHPDVRFLTSHGTRDDRARAVLSAIYWDSGRSLIESALELDQFDLDQELPEDSIGRNLQVTLDTVFEGRSTEAIKELRQRSPLEYATLLQGGLVLLSGRQFRRQTTSVDSSDSERTELGESDTQSSQATPSPRGSGQQVDEPATYKQIRFISGLSGRWLGAKTLEEHREFPQPPLSKAEAHKLIDSLNVIPESLDQKRLRGAVVDSFLRERALRPSQP